MITLQNYFCAAGEGCPGFSLHVDDPAPTFCPHCGGRLVYPLNKGQEVWVRMGDLTFTAEVIVKPSG